MSGVALVTAGAGSAPLVLAHGGGVPEAAAVGLPVLVLLVFAVLERRARRREREQAGGPEGERGDA